MIEDNLKKFNIIIHEAPAPVGSYVAYNIINKILYISGQISVDLNGNFIKGKLGKDITLENINIKASKDGFSSHSDIHNASKIPYFYREGFLQPKNETLIHLENINSYLINKDFPITEETETEVSIKLKKNTEKGRKKAKNAIIKKIEEAAGIILKKKNIEKKKNRERKKEL